MKKHASIVVFLLLSLFGRFQAAGQVQPDSTLMEKYLLDFVVPDMPAFKALGSDPSNLLRPSDIKKFAAMLTPFYSNNTGVIPKNFAAEFAPWKMAPNKWTLQEYTNSAYKRFLYRSSFSLGTINDTTKFPAKLAIGYRVSFLSKRADIYRAAQVRNDIFGRTGVVNMQDTQLAFDELTDYWVINIVKPTEEITAYYESHIDEFNKFLVDIDKILAANPDTELDKRHKAFINSRTNSDISFARLVNLWNRTLVRAKNDSVPCCRECPEESDSFILKVNNYLKMHPDTTLAKLAKMFLENRNLRDAAMQDLIEYWAMNIEGLNINRVNYYQDHMDEFNNFLVNIKKYLIQHPDAELARRYNALVTAFNVNDPSKSFTDEELKDIIGTFGKKVDEYLENYKKDNWNAGRFDLALALAAQSPDTLISHAQFALFSVWATWAIRVHKGGQLLLGGNFTLPRTNKNFAESVKPDTRTSFNINARYYVGTQDFRGFFETQYKYKNYDVANKSLLLNLGAEFRMGNMFWVVASAGLDNYLSESNPLNKFVSSLDLRYFFNKPR